MAKENITPEEKLLKIIENPDVKKRPPPVAARMKSIGAVPSMKDWLDILHIDKNTFKKFSLKLVNKLIIAACVFITAAWLYNFIGTGVKLSKSFNQIMSAPAPVSAVEQKHSVDITLDEVLTQVKRRNMFTFMPTKEEAQAAVNIGLTLGNLKLVGILWSDSPQAMIENSKEQKTYFVSKGDRIGDVEVRNILRDKVVVGKGEEEWELR